MRHHHFLLVMLGLTTGCSTSPTPVSPKVPPPVPAVAAVQADAVSNEPELKPTDPNLPEIQPAMFASWPSATEKPIEIGPRLWRFCRGPSPEEERERTKEKEANGPHASYSIVVRVSPNAASSFRAGGTLPEGAVVVKEKHQVSGGRREFQAYAFMIKREAGYDEANGDWEYAFVTLQPDIKVTRGKLAECSQCHAKASEHDYLFRNYLAEAK